MWVVYVVAQLIRKRNGKSKQEMITNTEKS